MFLDLIFIFFRGSAFLRCRIFDGYWIFSFVGSFVFTRLRQNSTKRGSCFYGRFFCLFVQRIDGADLNTGMFDPYATHRYVFCFV